MKPAKLISSVLLCCQIWYMRHLQISQFQKHITLYITNLPGEGAREGGRDGGAAGFRVSSFNTAQNSKHTTLAYTQQKCKTSTTWQHRKWKTIIKSDLCFFVFCFVFGGHFLGIVVGFVITVPLKKQHLLLRPSPHP